MNDAFVKKPCKHCPFRSDVKPFLHPERAEQLAYSTYNPYNDFACHKTTEYCDESDDLVATNESKTCAGFLTLMAQNDDRYIPEGFKPSFDIVYEDAYTMVDAYEEEWEAQHKKH